MAPSKSERLKPDCRLENKQQSLSPQSGHRKAMKSVTAKRCTDSDSDSDKPGTRSDLAPRSSGKEDSRKLETFRRNPAGDQSRPVELDQQPEASLAWWVGNLPCEV